VEAEDPATRLARRDPDPPGTTRQGLDCERKVKGGGPYKRKPARGTDGLPPPPKEGSAQRLSTRRTRFKIMQTSGRAGSVGRDKVEHPILEQPNSISAAA
jgi:hypothetical protein